MSHATDALKDLKAPEAIQLPKSLKVVAALAVVAGAGALYWSYSQGHHAQTWGAYLIGAFYALGLGLFGVLWVAMLYLSKGVWSVSMRRIPEAMTAWILPGGGLILLVGLGAHSLYHWTDPSTEDPLLLHKAPFLNMELFYTLIVASLVLWQIFAFAIVRNSRKQDKTGKIKHSRTNVALSAAFVVVYAITFSVVSFYLLMSLEPHWFSTMYAVLLFTDMMQTGTAFVALIAAILIMKGQLKGFLNENHLHSVSKMMFATTGFWAYIYFCQYMLIWYGNIPEETAYFLTRYQNGWLGALLALPLLKFVIPFVLLVPRENKRKPGRVAFLAVLILVAQFLELFLLVSPALGHGDHAAHGHWPVVEGAVTAGFVGLFFLVFSWSLGRNSPVPLKDPRLRECLNLHQ
jgi:hypothetical protein